MAFEDIWEDLENKVQGDPDSGSDISVEPINAIAHAVIKNEQDITSKADQVDVDLLFDESSDHYGNYTELNEKIGDIETALDSIIAIQNELLGVSE